MPKSNDKIGRIIYIFHIDIFNFDKTAKNKIQQHKTDANDPPIKEYEWPQEYW